jgi:2-dehydropantoate 2-reductase
MRIGIFGAGAIGGFLAAKLEAAGHEIGLVARGAHLAALKADGLRVESGGKVTTSRPKVVENPAELGQQDFVLVTVKGPGMAAAAQAIAPMLGPDTPVVSVMNGIPWWFFSGFGGAHDGRQLQSTDPGGKVAAALDNGRVIGCVAHIGCSVPSPGIVRHTAGDWFIIGEPQGGESGRCRTLAGAFRAAGLKCDISPRIQRDIWMKYLGNMSMNPVSVLTGGTLREIARDPGTREICRAMMEEAVAVGRGFDLDPGISIEERIELGDKIGDFKSSMLQDFEGRRPMEIDTFLGAAIEMAALAGVAVPTIQALRTLLVHKARISSLYPAH